MPGLDFGPVDAGAVLQCRECARETGWCGAALQCASCTFIGCLDGGHAHRHAHESGHVVFVDAAHRQTFCAACNDYVYDSDFDRAIDTAWYPYVRARIV